MFSFFYIRDRQMTNMPSWRSISSSSDIASVHGQRWPFILLLFSLKKHDILIGMVENGSKHGKGFRM